MIAFFHFKSCQQHPQTVVSVLFCYSSSFIDIVSFQTINYFLFYLRSGGCFLSLLMVTSFSWKFRSQKLLQLHLSQILDDIISKKSLLVSQTLDYAPPAALWETVPLSNLYKNVSIKLFFILFFSFSYFIEDGDDVELWVSEKDIDKGEDGEFIIEGMNKVLVSLILSKYYCWN